VEGDTLPPMFVLLRCCVVEHCGVGEYTHYIGN
jgi:hypothetical protein